jgi:hypothetical protein
MIMGGVGERRTGHVEEESMKKKASRRGGRKNIMKDEDRGTRSKLHRSHKFVLINLNINLCFSTAKFTLDVRTCYWPHPLTTPHVPPNPSPPPHPLLTTR